MTSFSRRSRNWPIAVERHCGRIQRGASTAELPREKQMLESGDWQDTCYAACCFMGARCKQQRLRHNIQEISQWPPLQCHHQHDPDEWKPYTLDGQRIFPSHEEAEYTAPLAFAIAVSTSWWAVRIGRAKLRVPRMPPTEAVGRREHWLHYDPRSMRSWAVGDSAGPATSRSSRACTSASRAPSC